MKIALCQINPTVGDLFVNSRKILAIATEHNADIFVFPELSITGYCPQDLILSKEFIKRTKEALKLIIRKTDKNLILVFFYSIDSKTYNAAAFIENKKIQHVYYKQQLPNYAVFDEKRWFAQGKDSSIFPFQNKKVALNICEDIWAKDVCRQQNTMDPHFFINISASPYSSIKIEKIENILLQRNKETKKPILFVNQVGAQDGLVYYGHSMFIDKGKIVKMAKDFEEDVLVIDMYTDARRQ